MGNIISIASQKGGVAKTTTSISLSAGLARQANSSKVLLHNYLEIPRSETLYSTLIDKQPLPIHKTAVSNLDIVPSHIYLSGIDVELASSFKREERLKKQLDAIKQQYDYVFIDCPPALGLLSINAFTASDNVLIVVSPGYFELDSLIQISDVINNVVDELNPHLEVLGFLFAMADPTVNSRDSHLLLRKTYGDKVLKTVIPRNTDVRDAHFNKQDIFAYSPKAAAALAYSRLINELFHL
jgi:chromosome partitioning protein